MFVSKSVFSCCGWLFTQNVEAFVRLVDSMFSSLQIYQFPECDSDEDEDFKQQDRELKASIPFAVIGSNCVIEVAGKKMRGRQYPWGIVEGSDCVNDDWTLLTVTLHHKIVYIY